MSWILEKILGFFEDLVELELLDVRMWPTLAVISELHQEADQENRNKPLTLTIFQKDLYDL